MPATSNTTTAAPRPVTVNPTQRLYIIPCGGGGHSCHGFDVVERLISRLSGEGIACPLPPAPVGTPERYAQYREMCQTGADRNRATGWRSSAELTPELIGKEGKRVEVTHRWESGERETTRFYVGKSTGWMPCHLEIARRNSSGGPAVCFGTIESVRVIQ